MIGTQPLRACKFEDKNENIVYSLEYIYLPISEMNRIF